MIFPLKLEQLEQIGHAHAHKLNWNEMERNWNNWNKEHVRVWEHNKTIAYR